MNQYFLIVVFAFLSISVPNQLRGQASTETDQQVNVIEKDELGNTKNVHCEGNLFFAGQFEEDDIAVLKSRDITRVISLRTEGEVKWNEAEAVENAGMEFIRVPFRSSESLTDDVFDTIRELLSDRSETTLFHCGSANRVGGVWLPYRVLDQGVALEQALEEAHAIGLRTAFIEEKALEYIRSKQLEMPPGEKSVKPGINKAFLSPDVAVEQFVDQFEIESREVYTQRLQILNACEIKPGDTVADVGAGTGLFTRLISREVGEQGWVFAIEIAPRFLEHINKEARQEKLNNITGVLCAENNVCLPPNSVDFVFICDTYHHFEYPKSTMESIYRSLRRGGRLVVVDFERIEGKSREWVLGHVRAGKEVFRAEIQDAGFTLVEEKKLDGLRENYFLMFRKL